MDLTTLIRILVGTFLTVRDIRLGKLDNLYDTKSILTVARGMLVTTTVGYPLSILINIPKHIMVSFRRGQYNTPKLADQLVDLAMIAGQNGLLALEGRAGETRNPFFEQDILMIVDASDPDGVRLMPERELENMITCRDAATGLYEKTSAYAPASGMVGTLVGLINMFKGLNLDGSGDAPSLGEDMSIVLVTTLYGSVLPNLISHPTAKKLRIRQDEGELYYSTIIEGIMVIQPDENPKYLREHLLASLKQSQQRELLSGATKNVPGGGKGN